MTLTPRLRFLVLCGLLLLPLCFAGYGSDNDTYGVLDSGRVTWLLHHLDTSRNPGYWLFEAIVFALSSLGGYLVTNLATLAISLLCLWRFLRLAGRLALPHPFLTAATLAATPVFAIASTSTDDYVWSLLGLLLFVDLLLEDRLTLAILPAAFAVLIRGANGVVIAGILAGAIFAEVQRHHRLTPRTAKLAATGLAAALLGLPAYALSWIAAHHTFAFLRPAIGPETMWPLHMRLGRFAYKLAYLCGPIAILTAAFAIRKSAGKPNLILAGAVLANLVLFLRYPIEISYLIPAACFGLLLLGRAIPSRRWAVAVFLAVLSLNFVIPQLAAPDRAGAATAAHLHPALAPGILIEDLRTRLRLKHCSDYDCYKDVTTTSSPSERR